MMNNNNQAMNHRSGERPAQSNETGLSTYSYGTYDQVARFTDATKAIAELASMTYNYSKEIWMLLIDKTEATFTEPSISANANDKVDWRSTTCCYECGLTMKRTKRVISGVDDFGCWPCFSS